MRNIFFLLFLGILTFEYSVTFGHVLKPKIIGGRDTNITEVPWQLLKFVNGSQQCGAVIIGPQEVLTAGHCFPDYGDAIMIHTVRAGSDQRDSGGIYYTVVDFKVHPEYEITEGYITHDIAFARVDRPFEFSESVQPIKLAKNEPKEGAEALISGFGLKELDMSDPTNITAESPTVLQSVVLPIVGRETCREWYSDFYWEVRDDQICIGIIEGGQGACYGDSGGPLVVNNELVGVTSWGDPCATPHHPGVYTSVPVYRDWIEEQLNLFK